MSSIPHNARFRYLFNRRSLRAFVVPMDHGISMGPIPGLYDMAETVGQMAGTADFLDCGMARYAGGEAVEIRRRHDAVVGTTK